MAEFKGCSAESCLNFFVETRSLPPKGLALALEANEKERAALAQAHGLLAVRAFSASLALKPWKKQGVILSGRIKARVAQRCVLTAEPMENEIDEPFEACFVPESSHLAKPAEDGRGELFLDPEGADAPEVFSGGRLNAGAALEEFFELAIDPYPRKAGARPADKAAGSGAGAALPASPFAALKALKNKGRR